MNGALVDSNIILDILTNDPIWANWSETTLNHYGNIGSLFINNIIYAELSIGFDKIETLEFAIKQADFEHLPIPKEALFLAGKAFIQYRRNKGTKSSPLPDFYIGAQAAILKLDLITRDVNRYRTYFPTLNIIAP